MCLRTFITWENAVAWESAMLGKKNIDVVLLPHAYWYSSVFELIVIDNRY